MVYFHGPTAICYWCGDDVPETPRFGNEACCDKDACLARQIAPRYAILRHGRKLGRYGSMTEAMLAAMVFADLEWAVEVVE